MRSLSVCPMERAGGQVSYGGYETDRAPAGGVKWVDTDGWSLGEEGGEMWSMLLHAVLCWVPTDKIAYSCFFYWQQKEILFWMQQPGSHCALLLFMPGAICSLALYPVIVRLIDLFLMWKLAPSPVSQMFSSPIGEISTGRSGKTVYTSTNKNWKSAVINCASTRWTKRDQWKKCTSTLSFYFHVHGSRGTAQTGGVYT